MLLRGKNMTVELNEETGLVSAIRLADDPYGMNWVLDGGEWGRVLGFRTMAVETAADGLTLRAETQTGVRLTVTRTVREETYTERYVIENASDEDFFLDPDTYGILFPFACLYGRRPNLHDVTCVAHVWPGRNDTWLYAVRQNGETPYLTVRATAGDFDAYSLEYDTDRAALGADYRGAIVLHPTARKIKKNDKLSLQFSVSFEDKRPELTENGAQGIRLSADRYTLFRGETATFTPICEGTGVLTVDGARYEVKGGRVSHTFERAGEYLATLTADGKTAVARLFVSPPFEDVLFTRADFIAEKQQVRKEGDPLDGALLIYDPETDGTYYSLFADHNACRERVSMGVTIFLAVMRREKPLWRDALLRHRAFVEREFFHTETGVVCNGIGYENKNDRPYNYPWLALYYYLWYRWTGEKRCLVYAGRIMNARYKVMRAKGYIQESPCTEYYLILTALEKEGETALYRALRENFLAHAEGILQKNEGFSEEVSCGNGFSSMKVTLLCDAYRLTGDPKYLAPVSSLLDRGDAFRAYQPDFHLYGNPVRYWDGFWFGKTRTYGDTQPQWLCAMAGEAELLLSRLTEPSRLSDAEANLRSGLCLYREDGFAHSCYYPARRMRAFSATGKNARPTTPHQTVYGACYDGWANDQDWVLWYASKLF